MRTLIFALMITINSLQAGEPVRDLTKYPLSINEKTALKKAKAMAEYEGQKLHPKCVNASFAPRIEPVLVQFYKADKEGETCIDPHYSIEVSFKGFEVTYIRLIDN